MIGPEDMAFLDEAKKAFEKDPILETYRDAHDMFIALRMGLDRDCVEIYKLNYRVANFTQQIEPVLLNKTVITQEEL